MAFAPSRTTLATPTTGLSTSTTTTTTTFNGASIETHPPIKDMTISPSEYYGLIRNADGKWHTKDNRYFESLATYGWIAKVERNSLGSTGWLNDSKMVYFFIPMKNQDGSENVASMVELSRPTQDAPTCYKFYGLAERLKTEKGTEVTGLYVTKIEVATLEDIQNVHADLIASSFEKSTGKSFKPAAVATVIPTARGKSLPGGVGRK
jgi:hypothetical protein